MSLFLFGLSIVFVLLLFSCASVRPSVDVHFWAGDSEKKGISRAQDHETISCEDPRFDGYLCLSIEDVREIYEVLLKCKEEKREGSLLSYEKREPI